MKNAIKKSFICLQLLALIFAFGRGSEVAGQNADVKPGSWGGRGISLLTEKNSATIALDCAKVTISSRLRTRKDGKFAATGLLTRTGPGPIRLDSPPKPQPVWFEGKLVRKQMSLKITLADSGDIIGTYILERDTQGQLVRCF